jgi:hypothetical protein
VLGGVTITVVNADREDGTGANVHAVKSHGGAEGGRLRNNAIFTTESSNHVAAEQNQSSSLVLRDELEVSIPSPRELREK